MSNFKIKKLPPIKLVDLLKKRKTNLKNFLTSSGVTTYTLLVSKCDSLGVSPPSEEEFKDAVGDMVSSPQEGVIVLDSPSLLKDSGEKVQVDEVPAENKDELAQPQEPANATLDEVSAAPQKSTKKKKEVVADAS